MHQSYLSEPSLLSQALDQERPRLLRLCTAWVGDPVAAEDVVQETLLEAWRKIDTLREPQAFQSWLSGIARNMSLRWLRRRGQESAALVPEDQAAVDLADFPADFDFELELDRADLGRLLEQALTLLPDETRAILIQKYIDEAAHSDIAGRLGISENVVAVRLHRGRLALRRALAEELRTDASALGLLTADDTWQETRIWCTGCGQRRLLGRLNETEFVLRCPDCNKEPGSYHSQAGPESLQNHKLKSFRPTLKRFSTLMDEMFQAAIAHGSAPCRVCGRELPLKLTIAHYAPPSIRALRGLHIFCPACRSGSYESLDGLALNLEPGREFFQNHPRLRSLPQREIDFAGTPAVVVSFTEVNGSAAYDVILKEDSYETLAVHSSDD